MAKEGIQDFSFLSFRRAELTPGRDVFREQEIKLENG
jgi:hypothetical protein